VTGTSTRPRDRPRLHPQTRTSTTYVASCSRSPSFSKHTTVTTILCTRCYRKTAALQCLVRRIQAKKEASAYPGCRAGTREAEQAEQATKWPLCRSFGIFCIRPGLQTFGKYFPRFLGQVLGKVGRSGDVQSRVFRWPVDSTSLRGATVFLARIQNPHFPPKSRFRAPYVRTMVPYGTMVRTKWYQVYQYPSAR
jgi:hypothetical protein